MYNIFLARITRISLFFVWVPAKGCLWTRKNLSFYLDTFSEVYQEADFHAGGFQVVDELGAVCRVKVFYGLELEDDGVFNNDVCCIVADQLVLVITFDFFSFSVWRPAFFSSIRRAFW